MRKLFSEKVKKMLKFKGKIRLNADVYVVSIPKAYIKHGMLIEGVEYEFNVEELV